MSRMSDVFVFGKDKEAVQMLPGVTRKSLAYSATMIVCEIRLEKGAVIPSHQHVHEQSSTIISGKLRYTVGDETRLVGAGDSVMLASNEPHSIVVEEDALVIDVFTPLRAEYI